MKTNHQPDRSRLRRAGSAVLLALLLLFVSLSIVGTVLAGHSGGGGYNECGRLKDVIEDPDIVDGDTIFMLYDKPTSENDPVIVEKNVTIQGGWVKIDPSSDCPDGNYFETQADVEEEFTYDPDGISPVIEGHDEDRTLIIDESVSNLTLQQLEFRQNSRGGIGGVIDNGAEVRLEKVTFYCNGWDLDNCTGLPIGNVSGGGLNLIVRGGSRLVISDSHFIDNYAYDSPGGAFYIEVYDNSEVLIHNTHVLSNSTGGAGQGGGGHIYIDSGTVTIQDSTFLGNNTLFASHTEEGGGLSIATSTNGSAIVRLINNTFQGNISNSDGGGVHLVGNNSTTFHLIGNKFIDNQANGSDGGGGVYQKGGNSFITNNLLARNSAVEGNGFYINSGTASIVHNTIVAPDAGGEDGILVVGGAVEIKNTIFAGFFTFGVLQYAGTVTEDYNLYYNNEYHRYNVAKGSHTIDDSNPNFVDQTNGDYHLAANSLAIDQGVDAGITTDFEGDSRPQGDGFDIGADERLISPVLAISKTGPATAKSGDPILYTLTVANSGEGAASNLFITDKLPAGATFIEAQDGGQLVGDEVHWNVANLAAGGKNVSVRFVASGTTGTLTNSDYDVTADGGVAATGSNAVVTEVSDNPSPPEDIFVYLPTVIKQ